VRKDGVLELESLSLQGGDAWHQRELQETSSVAHYLVRGGSALNAGTLNVPQCEFGDNRADAQAMAERGDRNTTLALRGRALYSTGAMQVANSKFMNNIARNKIGSRAVPGWLEVGGECAGWVPGARWQEGWLVMMKYACEPPPC
jgi:hypothetical protein